MDPANQVEASKFAIPDSIIVGTAGAERERSACVSPGVAIRDWKLSAERAGLGDRESKWVFASRVMQSGTRDIAVSGSALANHIHNMRGPREGNHRDVLRGIPHFSMHIIRFTTCDHILDETDLPPATASLMMIGHEIASDRRNEFDRVGQTGKR